MHHWWVRWQFLICTEQSQSMMGQIKLFKTSRSEAMLEVSSVVNCLLPCQDVVGHLEQSSAYPWVSQWERSSTALTTQVWKLMLIVTAQLGEQGPCLRFHSIISHVVTLTNISGVLTGMVLKCHYGCCVTVVLFSLSSVLLGS